MELCHQINYPLKPIGYLFLSCGDWGWVQLGNLGTTLGSPVFAAIITAYNIKAAFALTMLLALAAVIPISFFNLQKSGLFPFKP